MLGTTCDAGFELPSKALQLGKKLLLRPLNGQMEQTSNALAIQELGLGSVMRKLDTKTVNRWLKMPSGRLQSYPDVAGSIAE